MYEQQVAAFGWSGTTLRGRTYPVVNVMMGQAIRRTWPCGHAHPELAGVHPSLAYGHPPPPGVCCQATPDGGTICSDGFVGPRG